MVGPGTAWKVDGRAQALVGPGLATPLIMRSTFGSVWYHCLFIGGIYRSPSIIFVKSLCDLLQSHAVVDIGKIISFEFSVALRQHFVISPEGHVIFF